MGDHVQHAHACRDRLLCGRRCQYLIEPGARLDAADFITTPSQDEPYIMWDGTPYEHLMVPVTPTADELLADLDEVTVNTMRSSPASVALNARIMGYPEQEDGDMRVVQEGTNGWICWPDKPTSPSNDPSCNDAMMEAFWSIGDTQNVERVGRSYILQGGSDPGRVNVPKAPPHCPPFMVGSPKGSIRRICWPRADCWRNSP